MLCVNPTENPKRPSIERILSVFSVISLALCLASPMAYAQEARSGEPVGIERARLFAENPWLIEQISVGGGFGNTFSRAISNQMYSRRDAAALADASQKLEVKKYGRGTWVLRFPIVNLAVFETQEGLVLVDSGYAPAGPALKDALKELSDKPVHTIILTHHHVDHALGAWALLQGEDKPQVVATHEFIRQQQRDLDLARYTARRNHQAPGTSPKGWADVVKPDRLFTGTLTLQVGGERFELKAARGETADQLYVYVPGRKTLVTADYYQKFIPNAGNGRRPMRYVDEWASALADMAALNARLMIPMHGPVLTKRREIKDRLTAHAGLLKSIDDQVKADLNAGIPEYLVADRVALPKQYRDRDDVAELYVSVPDIAKMVLHQQTGWWNDQPAHWNPPPLPERAAKIVHLAGGIQALLEHIDTLLAGDLKMASYLADQAFFAEPGKVEVLTTAYRVYLTRLKRDKPPVQEALSYIDHLVYLRNLLKDLGAKPPAPM